MQQRLVPAAAASETLESYLAQSSGARHPVYIACLIALALTLIALPLLKVDVSVQAPGLVRPTIEKNEVKVPVSGRIAEVMVRANATVREGAALARLDSPELNEQVGALQYRLQQTKAFIRDLQRLTQEDPGQLASESPARGSIALVTSRYARELAQLHEELAEPALLRGKALQDLQRAQQLHQRGFASDSAVEDQRQTLLRLEAAARLTAERYRTRWQAELAQYGLESNQVESQLAQLAEQRERYTIVAPVAGTVEELASVTPGSYVQAGERLGVISPSTATVAEIYVSPTDVGLLRVGTPVRIQVDAFRASEWGFLRGRVTEIADDFIVINQISVFRVHCSLERPTLTLPNGAVGRLKKGMTLRANFIVARRSVFQLLWDNASDWVDPRFNTVARP